MSNSKFYTWLIVSFMICMMALSTGLVDGAEYNVSGSIYSTDGYSGINGATLEFVNSSGLVTDVLADSTGEYEIDVEEGAYTVYINATGYEPVVQDINLATSFVMDIGLTPNAPSEYKIYGYTRESGIHAPISNAYVLLLESSIQIDYAYTDGTAYFEFEAPDGNYELDITADGYETENEPITVSGSDVDVDIFLDLIDPYSGSGGVSGYTDGGDNGNGDGDGNESDGDFDPFGELGVDIEGYMTLCLSMIILLIVCFLLMTIGILAILVRLGKIKKGIIKLNDGQEQMAARVQQPVVQQQVPPAVAPAPVQPQSPPQPAPRQQPAPQPWEEAPQPAPPDVEGKCPQCGYVNDPNENFCKKCFHQL
jgi:hypothetical protein